MAEKIISPGVFTRENDLSFLQQGVASIGAAFIGPFKEGPLVPTIVNSQSEFLTLFGADDGTYYTPTAVTSYLKEAGTATICRVGGIGGYTERAPLLVSYTTNSVQTSLAVLFNADTQTASFTTGIVTSSVGTTAQFTLSGSLAGGAFTASLNSTDASNVNALFGYNPKVGANGVSQIYTYAYFTSASTAVNFTSGSVTASVLPNQNFAIDAQEATTPYIQSQLISGQRFNLFRFQTLGAGNIANQKVKVGITNIKPAGTVNGTDYGTFTVVVRDYNDTNKKKIVLETFSNVTLDPNSPNYIYRVIGDRYITIDGSGKLTEYGDWVLNSKYIRLIPRSIDPSVSADYIPVAAVPYAHAAYSLPIYTGNAGLDRTIPVVTYLSASATQYGGMDFDNNNDNSIYNSPIPANAGTGSNTAYSLDTFNGYALTGSVSTDVAVRNFLIGFQSGFDGMSPTIPIYKGTSIAAGNTQGFDLSTSTASGSIAYGKHVSALSNADQWDINMVVTPGVISRLHLNVASSILSMVEQRADAFYLMDTTAPGDTIQQAVSQAIYFDSNYAATYYPWVKAIDVNTNKLNTVPPTVLLPGVFAANDRVAAEWFAPAGLNRGGLTGAVSVLNRLTQDEKDTLYQNKVNPIVQFPGTGIVAFGQKTLQDKPSALDRINVRRLLLTVRKYIASSSKYLVFEQNTATTRQKFLNIVNPYLEAIQQRQGLYAFRVVMDNTNNTPDMIDRNFLVGSIYLQPTKTAEFIQIDFNILPTGASFGA
jgi:hypothetical protein